MINDKEVTVDQLVTKALSRRKVLAMGAGAAASIAMMSVGGGKVMADIADTSSATPTDIHVLNFALNLEYLEAEFYSVAVDGKNIQQFGVGVSGKGTYGPTTGGAMVDFSSMPMVGAIATEIGKDERKHVEILRAALGNAAIAKPAINLDAAGQGFADVGSFLVLARAFEDTGVTAYAGASPLLSPAYIQTAAQILAVEAFHSGNIRLNIAQDGINTGKLDAKDILPPPSGTEYFPTSGGLVQLRTPAEVLKIVYATSDATSGGFFPNGVNGYFVKSS